ncbi:MAG TPA: hypothetical protein VF766_06635 [Pyrinomonadaceae bacterium]
MEKDEKDIVHSESQGSDGMSEAEIDRNLMETFPASDPPSWTLGTNHRQEVKSEKDKPADSDESE